MRSKSVIRRLLNKGVVPAASMLAMAYFIFHALGDENGLSQVFSLQKVVLEKQAALDALRTERAALENKVNGLRSKNIDPDLLDERARETLGLARPDEIIIFNQK